MTPSNKNKFYEVNHLDKNALLYKKKLTTSYLTNKQLSKISTFVSDKKKNQE